MDSSSHESDTLLPKKQQIEVQEPRFENDRADAGLVRVLSFICCTAREETQLSSKQVSSFRKIVKKFEGALVLEKEEHSKLMECFRGQVAQLQSPTPGGDAAEVKIKWSQLGFQQDSQPVSDFRAGG